MQSNEISDQKLIPDRRFRPEPMTAKEAIEWCKTHKHVWYQAPMHLSPIRLDLSSKLKTWKKSPERFEISATTYSGEKLVIRIDNGHLDCLRMPHDLWHHGISAVVHHVDYVGHRHQIVVSQSNGFHLQFVKLAHAITFARIQSMELTAKRGKRTRILVPAVAPISGERGF
jgi:hypothetical protein